MNKINKNNFFDFTTVNFTEVEFLPKDAKLSFVSKSDSAYWYNQEGVYRESDHWGCGIATCNWFLNNRIENCGSYYPVIGFARWEDFKPLRRTTENESFYLESLGLEIQDYETFKDIYDDLKDLNSPLSERDLRLVSFMQRLTN